MRRLFCPPPEKDTDQILIEILSGIRLSRLETDLIRHLHQQEIALSFNLWDAITYKPYRVHPNKWRLKSSQAIFAILDELPEGRIYNDTRRLLLGILSATQSKGRFDAFNPYLAIRALDELRKYPPTSLLATHKLSQLMGLSSYVFDTPAELHHHAHINEGNAGRLSILVNDQTYSFVRKHVDTPTEAYVETFCSIITALWGGTHNPISQLSLPVDDELRDTTIVANFVTMRSTKRPSITQHLCAPEHTTSLLMSFLIHLLLDNQDFNRGNVSVTEDGEHVVTYDWTQALFKGITHEFEATKTQEILINFDPANPIVIENIDPIEGHDFTQEDLHDFPLFNIDHAEHRIREEKRFTPTNWAGYYQGPLDEATDPLIINLRDQSRTTAFQNAKWEVFLLTALTPNRIIKTIAAHTIPDPIVRKQVSTFVINRLSHFRELLSEIPGVQDYYRMHRERLQQEAQDQWTDLITVIPALNGHQYKRIDWTSHTKDFEEILLPDEHRSWCTIS